MAMWSTRGFVFLAACYVLYVNGDTTPDFQSNDRLSKLEKLFKAQSQQISDLTELVQEQNMEIYNLKQEVRRLADRVNTNDKLHSNPNQTFRGPPPTRDMKMLPKAHYSEKDVKTTIELPLANNHTAQVNAGSFIRKERLLINNAENGHTVGFYAFLSQPELFGKHKVMVFDIVRTNVGNGYSNHSGVFTAPISGLFGFTWTLFPSHVSRSSLDVLRNNNVEAVMFVDSDTANWDLSSSSMTVVLLLNQGDEVYIRTRSGYPNHLGTLESGQYAKSAFAGWLIH